ncbi:MAG: hypothetical protein NC181_04640 [Clostridium sp.]|nr:hypothetical protein [Clostridium sp.]MCM1444537.1 hypothetical protein [Candidatus Amulumruptor caecigallinarius]
MSKININVTLIEDNKKIYDNVKYIGIKSDNRIVYKENDITVTLSIFDNYVCMKRSSKDYVIDLVFMQNEETKITYNIKQYGIVYLTIFTKRLLVKDYINIEYYVKEQDKEYEFNLFYEVIEK